MISGICFLAAILVTILGSQIILRRKARRRRDREILDGFRKGLR